MNPTVKAGYQTIDPGVKVACAKVAEQLFDFVRLAISVGVLGIENVRCGTDQHPFAPHGDTCGKWDSLQKHPGSFRNATFITLIQQTHSARRFIIAFWAHGIIEHFGHPKGTVVAKVDRHRALNHRFRSDDFDLHSRRNLDFC